MRQSKLRAVSARPWLLLLCLALAATAGVIQARAQPNSIGFISIDCGFPGTTSYVDDATTLPYAPDAAFTDAGENYNVSPAHVAPELPTIYRDVHSFADGARSCYTLRSLTVGLKYLLRASFMYGNYDGLDRPPVFDLYVGVNLWKTVDVSSRPGARVVAEAIVVVPDDFVQVCLVNTGSGTPFISGLELRPLKSSIYPQVNVTQGLLLHSRRNFGPLDSTDIVR
ncbi:putative LRR receptor-like serine/threonine-protein kinase [Zea mays]|uniref:Putative LRR receptor-like serine/threonine-protein kinase n=1 Tax=Zea mays TaxID=4577 RepID=A0A3L6EBP7_MAIZE|nr:putative LRR receptor-like serine/threonine-protein kinase [Zea mays]